MRRDPFTWPREECPVETASLVLRLKNGRAYEYTVSEPDAARLLCDYPQGRYPDHEDIRYGSLPITPDPRVIEPPPPVQFTVTFGFRLMRRDEFLRVTETPAASERPEVPAAGKLMAGQPGAGTANPKRRTRKAMTTELPGTWNEPDTKVLDQLLHQGMFAADGEAMKPGPPNRIRNPDGSQQGETPHEHTTRVVRAALRMLLANSLVTPVPSESWPEWVVLDPPEDSR